MASKYRYVVYVADWDDRLYFADRRKAWEAYGRLVMEHCGVRLTCDGLLLATD